MNNIRDEDVKEKPLTDEELREVRQNLRIFHTLQSLGLAGSWLKGLLLWLALIIGIYFTFNDWLIRFIRGAATGG